MLIKQKVKNELKKFMDKQNKNPLDYDQSASDFAEEIEKIIYDSIRSATITIPSGAIIIATANGPASNPSPIVLNGVIK